MNYEQKYKEALEKARQLCAYPTTQPFISDLQDLFPELKESEGEEIRNWLIGYFQEYKSTGIIEEFANGLKIDSIIAWLEKQDNNADKVESKFKVGDWIVSHYNHVAHIKAIGGKNYFLSCDNGSCERLSIEYIDRNWRLWTITDAKDGDVLCLGGVTAIFKKCIGQEKCICYCSFCDVWRFEIPTENGEDNVYGCTDTTPATKEQRDLLFQMMKEAGYEWNEDKKELKKL